MRTTCTTSNPEGCVHCWRYRWNRGTAHFDYFAHLDDLFQVRSWWLLDATTKAYMIARSLHDVNLHW